ncbi:hypothetical protein E2C01_024546 [Portunus trituberculatus]|uniref:Uncharacterized protein n=1 Tax=Portunus trituberculatus TaxID=210409 RepID=A0A5B7EAX7_PORTR|nr:hypothetical protein [Portunus trituberculatus]
MGEVLHCSSLSRSALLDGRTQPVAVLLPAGSDEREGKRVCVYDEAQWVEITSRYIHCWLTGKRWPGRESASWSR